ncbi:hypothetical protein FA95DRAFT_1505723, partial [Auriscalpium vulgare]
PPPQPHPPTTSHPSNVATPPPNPSDKNKLINPNPKLKLQPQRAHLVERRRTKTIDLSH